MRLLVALLLLPVIEIALFIEIGGLIGLWPTLLLVVLSAMLGSALIRRQGIGAVLALRSSLSDLRHPSGPLFDRAMILLAGVLLLIPGFLTDALGLALLVPPLRVALYRALQRRLAVARRAPARRPAKAYVIEGEFEILDPESGRGPTRH
jgi:UPF0716 protein FxsA